MNPAKNKKIHESNNKPVPVRLGGLKPLLQREAFENDISMNSQFKKIVRDYFERKGVNFNNEEVKEVKPAFVRAAW